MNQYYDTTRAKAALERLYQEANANESSKIPHLTGLKATDVVFEQVEYPPSMRLMVQEEDEHTEVVVRMQGVLCASTLPPYRRPPTARKLSNIRNLRQYVKLTSFGAVGFDEACKNLQEAWKRLQCQVEGESVAPFSFLPYEGNPCIEAHARYFTDRNLIPFEKNIPFQQHVDPNNVLANLKPEVFIHGPDNRVDYVQRTTDRNGCIRYLPCDPSSFKAGDLVEIAFSLVAVPIKEKRRLLYLNLKAMTLIDDSIRKDSEIQATRLTPPPTPAKIKNFKRRTVYVDLDKPEDEANKRRRTENDKPVKRGGETGAEGSVERESTGGGDGRETGSRMMMNVD